MTKKQKTNVGYPHLSKRLIVFSGLDCAGKSTQIDLLEKYLKDAGQMPKYLWSRGGYTTGFDALKSLLRKTGGKAVPASGHSKEREQKLGRPLVRKVWLTLAILDLIRVYAIQIRLWKLTGKTVICDRYLTDTLIDFKLNFPEENVENSLLWKTLTLLAPKPDVNFLLLIPAAESLKRSKQKFEPFPDSEEVLERRLKLYTDIARTQSWASIDCMEPVESVWNTIKTTIEG